jgi:UDP-GlcNAc:undecaprenyl-phosphate/decaprenyl-phosphate GlcNAc-1-phosphate transferase
MTRRLNRPLRQSAIIWGAPDHGWKKIRRVRSLSGARRTARMAFAGFRAWPKSGELPMVSRKELHRGVGPLAEIEGSRNPDGFSMTVDVNNPLVATYPTWGDIIHAWGELLRQFWLIPATALIVSLIATPICRRVALGRGIVDRPDDFLKPHGEPIPYLGGVAIFGGWLAGIFVAFASRGVRMQSPLMTAIALAGFATMLVGLFDDLRVMPARVKLACNIAIALLLLAFGLGDDLVNVVAQVTNVHFDKSQRWLELTYSAPVTIFIIVGACNATNLIDGLDGLCTGVLGIVSLGFVILAIHMRVIYPTASMGNERVVLALAVLGASVGFLPYNFNPARIFMGDAGSMLLGLNAAILLLMFGEARLVRWMIGALMVFGLPVADMLLTLIRRWRNGRPLMIGDRSHFYDQLRDRGLSVRQVVAVSYLLTLAFVVVGTSVIFVPTRYAVLIYFIAVLVIVAAVWKFNMASIDRNEPSRTESSP